MTIVSLILFAVTYIVMFAFQKIRPYAAVVSAIIFVILGSISLFDGYEYTFTEALGKIDWNVLLMIAGTMGTVSLFIESKMPQLMADVIVSKTKNMTWTVIALSLFAGLISAFVDNVATVLMVAPVALAICKKQNISPVSTIICIAISSNLQGAATLVGDTTSILLAKEIGLDFLDFFVDGGKLGMFWVVEAGALVSAVILFFMFRKDRAPVKVTERTKVDDLFPTFILIGTIAALIAVSFIPYKDGANGGFYKPDITNGIICMAFFAIGLIRNIIKSKSVKASIEHIKAIDFYTIALLAGLFVVIGGIEEAGLISKIGELMANIGTSSEHSTFLLFTVIVWGSVLLSAFIDNIPYTVTMLPVIAVLSEEIAPGNADIYHMMCYGLLCGATLGGNITPIGASANITGIGILRKEGYTVNAGDFMKYSVPFTLAAVTTGYLLLWLIWA